MAMHAPGGGATGSSSNSPKQASLRTVGGSSAAGAGEQRHRQPRSLPPWIDSYEAGHGAVTDDQLRLLNPPKPARPHVQNTVPSEPQRRRSKDGYMDWADDPFLSSAAAGRQPKVSLSSLAVWNRAPKRGRKWDHLRTAEPVIVPGHVPKNSGSSQAWIDFLHSSEYGRAPNEESAVVDFEVLNKLQPTFNHPVDVPANPLDPKVSRRRRTLALYQRVWHAVLRHSLSPLLFRLTVMITSLVALALSARIFEDENATVRPSSERSQSILGIIVDVLAVPYIGYMLWDEYTGKPLGLRSAIQKTSLILLDLFFIILKSASTSLAFESLVFHKRPDDGGVPLARALAAFMLLGLLSWTMTFMVNVFRTVERLGGGEDEGARR